MMTTEQHKLYSRVCQHFANANRGSAVEYFQACETAMRECAHDPQVQNLFRRKHPHAKNLQEAEARAAERAAERIAIEKQAVAAEKARRSEAAQKAAKTRAYNKSPEGIAARAAREAREKEQHEAWLVSPEHLAAVAWAKAPKFKQGDLLDRGWTLATISKYLGEPDRIEMRHKVAAGYYTINWYLADRVVALSQLLPYRMPWPRSKPAVQFALG